MESSSSEINQKGYLTPPRSNTIIKPSFSQPKILTSAELKRRFSPIHSSIKKRIRKNDCIVPLEGNLNMPVILKNLFDYKEELSIISEDDCIVPNSSLKIIYPQPIFDYSFKTKQENTFTISDTIMKQKLKLLLQKNLS